jgi:hypothetical protein
MLYPGLLTFRFTAHFNLAGCPAVTVVADAVKLTMIDAGR